jgi:hypothetical protein
MKWFQTVCCGTASLALGAGIIGINSGLHAISGVTGAAILDSSGYEGYNTTEAAMSGLVGGGIVGLPLGVIVSSIAAIASMGILSGITKEDLNTKSSSSCTVTSYVVSAILAGIIGQLITQPEMSLAQTAAAFALGSAVTCVPVSLVLLCVVLPMVLGSACLIATADQEFSHNNYNTFYTA